MLSWDFCIEGNGGLWNKKRRLPSQLEFGFRYDFMHCTWIRKNDAPLQDSIKKMAKLLFILPHRCAQLLFLLGYSLCIIFQAVLHLLSISECLYLKIVFYRSRRLHSPIALVNQWDLSTVHRELSQSF